MQDNGLNSLNYCLTLIFLCLHHCSNFLSRTFVLNFHFSPLRDVLSQFIHSILVDFLSFMSDDAVGVFVLHLIFLVIAAALDAILAADECSHFSEEAIGPESPQKFDLFPIFLQKQQIKHVLLLAPLPVFAHLLLLNTPPAVQRLMLGMRRVGREVSTEWREFLQGGRWGRCF